MEIVFRFPTEKQKFSAPEAHGSGREKGEKSLVRLVKGLSDHVEKG